MNDLVPSDMAILDLLRKCEWMTVADFRGSLGVTATAVRQRLTRLMAQGFVASRADRVQRTRASESPISVDSRGPTQDRSEFW